MQSVFSAVCPESGKARRVSRELIHVISACNCFVFPIEVAYACKKCSLFANKFQFYYFHRIHLCLGKNIAENYVKSIPLKQCCVKTICRILKMCPNNGFSEGHKYSTNTYYVMNHGLP
jgi:hypothetical protein